MTANARNDALPAGAAMMRRFTLLEMLAAMVVLTILMLVVFRLLASAERVWTLSNRNIEIYENARVILGVVTRDLQCAVAKSDDRPWYTAADSDIRFHQNADNELWFVSAVEEADASAGPVSRLVEVAYRNTDFTFERAVRTANATNWNIYGARSALGLSDALYMTVAEGVRLETFVCLDSASNVYVPNSSGTETGLPAAVSVTVRLLDRQSLVRWRALAGTSEQAEFESQVARTFTKVIYLGDRG